MDSIRDLEVLLYVLSFPIAGFRVDVYFVIFVVLFEILIQLCYVMFLFFLVAPLHLMTLALYGVWPAFA